LVKDCLSSRTTCTSW